MNVIVDSYATHAQLTNLLKFTSYSIYVVMMTKYDGVRSAIINVSTDEGSKFLALHRLNEQLIQHTPPLCGGALL